MLFAVFSILATSVIPFASAVQLDATILSNQDTTKPEFQFLRIMYIEYPDGGQLAELLQGVSQKITFQANMDTLGIAELKAQLNENLKSHSSDTRVTDLKVEYQAILQGNEKRAVMEYKIELIPTISNHVI